MKAFSIICLFVVVTAKRVPFNPELDEHWEHFKTKFNKNYEPNEEIARRLVWEQHVAKIADHNINYDLGLHSYRLGLNEYSDLTHEEFVQRMNGLKKGVNSTTKSAYTFMHLSNVVLPDTIDWRKEGLVTEVKNQLQCGSCWAFSTTGSLEGQHKKKTGKLVSLSEQNLVDCSGPEGNYGCEGGIMDQGFEYIKKNGGIDTEKSYPYEARDAKCRFKRNHIGATCTGYVDIPSGDEDALKQAAATIGPISVAIDASSNDFQSYSGGVYDEKYCSTTNLDHGVLVVGYGTTDDGKDYWLVKNSWGKSWGIKGYIMMSRNKENQCGIATQASYPLV